MRAGTRKLVFAAPNWLGDAVMSLPAIAEAGSSAGVSLAVMAPQYTARVYEGIDGVDEVVVVDGDGRAGRIRARARALRAVGADGVALLAPSFSSALSAWLSRTGTRVGLASDGRAALLTDSLPVPGREDEHLSKTYARIERLAIERLGGGVTHPISEAAPALRVHDRDREEAAAILSDLGVAGPPYACVAPGATYGSAKSWPDSRFRDLIRVLVQDVPVVLVGGAGERPLCSRIAAGIEGAGNAAGRTSLGGFFALVAGAAALLANDSGPPHVAGALGVPVVVLFGSTSPRWTRPLGEAVTVVRHPVHCSPCFRRTCPTQLECFDGISVTEALDSLRAALKKGVAESHPGF